MKINRHCSLDEQRRATHHKWFFSLLFSFVSVCLCFREVLWSCCCGDVVCCVLSFGVMCGVWHADNTCVHSTRPRVYVFSGACNFQQPKSSQHTDGVHLKHSRMPCLTDHLVHRKDHTVATTWSKVKGTIQKTSRLRNPTALWASLFDRRVSVLLVAPLLEFSLSVFGFCPTVCCDGFAIRCCLLCFVGIGPVSRDTCMNWARVYLRNAPVHALGPGLGQA